LQAAAQVVEISAVVAELADIKLDLPLFLPARLLLV
jgi:hypothetical protein